jgi:hypothetical protein
MENSSDIIGNRTRDLPVCSAVPQPLSLSAGIHARAVGRFTMQTPGFFTDFRPQYGPEVESDPNRNEYQGLSPGLSCQPVSWADKLAIFICRLFRNSGSMEP